MTIKYKIPTDNAEVVLRDALTLAWSAYVDELDYDKLERLPSNKTVEETIVAGLKNPKTKYNFTYRDMGYVNEPCYYDVGLYTNGINPDYFLWMKLHPKDGIKLIDKYQLT